MEESKRLKRFAYAVLLFGLAGLLLVLAISGCQKVVIMNDGKGDQGISREVRLDSGLLIEVREQKKNKAGD